MFDRMTVVSKILLVAVVVGASAFAFRKAAQMGLIPTPGIIASFVPEKITLPDLQDAQVSNVTPIALPTTKPATINNTRIRAAIWEWNAQMGLLYAVGGPTTTKGSLMEKRNVNLDLHRQDDTMKMQEELIACAKEIADGAKQCSSGANFVIIMGDGAGQFAAAVNPQLAKIGDKLEVIGSVGYSRGEDAFMASPAVKRDPNNAKGILVSGVLRDGDWNIAMKWAADNNIKNNPDEKTYDPDAINWINATDYNVAAADYVAGKCEDRKVVREGKPTGETKRVCVNAIVTWTPGDVTAVQKKGGLVKVVSSKEYRSQMPSTIIGSKRFFEQNREQITNMLAAIFEGSDQVKAFDAALKHAAQISATIYNDMDANYWYTYFKGTTETDREGNKVELGGSAVNNLQDNLILFGLIPGSNDNFRSTYTLFAKIAVQQYPEVFKDTPIPDVKEVVNKSYLTGAQAIMDSGSAADMPVFAGNANNGTVVSKRSYSIQFEVGKATLTEEGKRQLNELKDSLAITGLYIKVVGHTDNTGDEQKTNLPLSEARAAAIKAYLQSKSASSFPDKRFEIQGKGSLQPVASNSTNEGRAQNRRVEIVLVGN